MGFPVAAMLALAVALISSASRADGVDAEADCLLKCSGQYNICLASQVSTQAALWCKTRHARGLARKGRTERLSSAHADA